MLLTSLSLVDDQRPALRDDHSSEFISYGILKQRAAVWQRALEGKRSLVMLSTANTIDGVAALLGAWLAGHIVAMTDPNLPKSTMLELQQLYEPEFSLAPDSEGLLAIARGPAADKMDLETALLLSTSGSTGSPKFVRLTHSNLWANADAIAAVLDIRPNEVGCGHLPIHYSFGLSVLTSHLARGAPLLLTDKSFTDREFWPLLRECKVAHLPGVPFHFQMMERLRYERLALPELRVLTQAGGALDIASRRKAHQFMDQRGGRFNVMYGQTEASPRITTLSHTDFKQAPASVGTALPNGVLTVVGADGAFVPTGSEGRVIYRGPNVMQGYAERRSDLAAGDCFGGELDTGDIGFLDGHGRLTLTGRAKRFAKLYGLRVNLDEIELVLREHGDTAIVQIDDHIHVFSVSMDQDNVLRLLAERFTIPRSAYKFHSLEALPRTGRGKIDYRTLEKER